MANKVKEIKKKGRRLKRSIRKTLGTLFLVSALVVAAIPVDYLRADEIAVSGQAEIDRPNTERKDMKVSIKYQDDAESGIDWSNTIIPDVTQSSFCFSGDKTNIYRSENLVFDFAVSNMFGDSPYAVIIGYHNQNQMNRVGETLTIPRTVDAYAPYGSETGNLEESYACAIGGTQGELLFYKTLDKEAVRDENGTIIQEATYKYNPCLFKDKALWIGHEWNGQTNPQDSLYYLSGVTKYYQDQNDKYLWEESKPAKIKKDGAWVELQDSDWTPANESLRERYKDIDVWYIGNQRVSETNDATQTIEEIKIPEKDEKANGIFSDASVSSVKVEPNLKGIGKCAFAGTHIKTVVLDSSVVEIGSYAFTGCDLTSFTIGDNANNVIVGDHAFANCQELKGFNFARNVEKVGDSAFEGCKNLTTLDWIGEGENVISRLRRIGYYAFANSGLNEMIFPDNYTEKLLVSTFEGCGDLERIYAQGKSISFNVTGDDYYPLKKFREECAPGFFFEGPEGSDLENTVVLAYFVYKYSEQDVYKKRVPDKASTLNSDGTYSLNAIFEVTSLEEGGYTGEITDVQIEPGLKNLEIPGKVGELNVVEIGENGFEGNSNLINVIIPAEITRIGNNAFANCPNMENVFFDNPWTLTSNGENDNAIGKDAFKTGSAQLNFISGASFKDHNNSIEEEAFKYAMNKDNTINNSLTHIKYYTGWPTNLVVENQSGKSTLVEYPTFAKLADDALGSDSYYYKPELADGYKKAALSVGKEALGIGGSSEGTEKDKSDIRAAVENIVIPAGIEAVEKDLFKHGEADEKNEIGGNENARTPNKTLTVYGLDEIDDNAFEGAEYLTTVNLSGKTKSIGSYAFKDCTNLLGVSVTAPVNFMGTAPFIGCDKLSNVGFGGDAKFVCANSIIYEVDGGVKTALVEYLNGRGAADVKGETAGITHIYPEAFRRTDVHRVYLDDANFPTLEKGVFQDTLNLDTVTLPSKCGRIEDDAFTDSAIEYLTVLDDKCMLDPVMFRDTDEDGKTNLKGIEFTCPKDSNAWVFAERYSDKPPVESTGPFKVTFYGYNKESGEIDLPIEGYAYENVGYGTSVLAPKLEEVPVWEDHEFSGWDTEDYLQVTRNLEVKATYSGEYSVIFYDDDWKTVIWETSALPGKTVNPPAENNEDPPVRISKWRNKATGDVMTAAEIRMMVVNQDLEFIAEYDDSNDPGTSPSPGPDNPGNQSPSPSPGPGNQTPTPAPGGSTPTPNPGGTVPRPDGTFSLEVFNGSGTGHYAPGAQIVITADPAPEGQRFIGWDVSPSSTVMSDKTRVVTILTMPRSDVAVLAKYESESGSTNNGKLYNLQVSGGTGGGTYPAGAQVIITAEAAPENQEFDGWDVSPAETVVADKTKVATIITMPENDVAAIANYKSAIASTPTPEPTATPSAFHSVLVHNGSGSGSYAVGAQVVIVANDPAAGQEFTGWTVSPDNTVITDKTLPGAVITMPDNDVAVIANYKSKATGSGNTGSSNNTNTNNSGTNNNNNNNNSGGNSGNNSGNNSNTNTNRPSGSTGTNSGTTNRGGTTVVIDKNGLSNTGVVSATVNGSSDNFTIKITESSEATEAVLNALLAEYGSVDNIKYFPMDISLYDSTGNTKITDTTGLSVSITLPLPDSLITYAGNNKVAGVVNNRLDKLTPRFTTINGVSCITFTAEHFSPYVIYVDVANLSSGTVTDATPTTGDGIHPKWFLSIGLACLSFVMFMMKDGGKTSGKKRKVRVSA